jgi:hypothetical protein
MVERTHLMRDAVCAGGVIALDICLSFRIPVPDETEFVIGRLHFEYRIFMTWQPR